MLRWNGDSVCCMGFFFGLVLLSFFVKGIFSWKNSSWSIYASFGSPVLYFCHCIGLPIQFFSFSFSHTQTMVRRNVFSSCHLHILQGSYELLGDFDVVYLVLRWVLWWHLKFLVYSAMCEHIATDDQIVESLLMLPNPWIRVRCRAYGVPHYSYSNHLNHLPYEWCNHLNHLYVWFCVCVCVYAFRQRGVWWGALGQSTGDWGRWRTDCGSGEESSEQGRALAGWVQAAGRHVQ